MSAKQRPAIVRWLPAILLGILISESIFFACVWKGVCNWSWYAATVLVGIGALLGYDISRDAYGVYNALRAGRWIGVLFWAALGGIFGGMMGLLAKHTTPQQFAMTMPESPILTWLIWIAFGMAFGLMQVGGNYRTPDKTKT